MLNLKLLKIGVRSKKLPRGRSFKKGERLPFQYKPGQSGNPSGKSKTPRTMKANYEALLGCPAPSEVCRAVGAPRKAPGARSYHTACAFAPPFTIRRQRRRFAR